MHNRSGAQVLVVFAKRSQLKSAIGRSSPSLPADLAWSAAQAHHMRFPQPRVFGLKVSDEFTVPLSTAAEHFVCGLSATNI